MLGVDEHVQQRWRLGEARENAEQRRLRMLAEELENHSVTVSSDDGRDVSNLLAQIGRPLTCQQVIDRLQKCNSRLHFERSLRYPNLMGVYLLAPGRTPSGAHTTTKTHLFGMESGIMPEFSVRHKTKTKVANKELFGKVSPTRETPWKEVETFVDETRGWRTVLIRLLHAGLITRWHVEKYFGWTPSHDSQKWHDQTR